MVGTIENASVGWVRGHAGSEGGTCGGVKVGRAGSEGGTCGGVKVGHAGSEGGTCGE